jgi:hypothetical protein
MSTKRKWTKEEEEILVQAVKANPHNLAKAFREAAEQLGRTEGSVEIRWYGKLKKTSLCFVTISSNKQLKNGKNYDSELGHTNTPTKTSKTLWGKIKTLFNW